MKTIKDIASIESIIRSELIKQSQLPSNFVRNANSLYGPELNKTIDESILDSITHDDCLLLFELFTNDTSNNVSFEKDADNITYYRSFRIQITVYGESSTNVASKLIARLRMEDSTMGLQDAGIHVESIQNSNTFNEFINGTVWLRNDFDIYISCELEVEKVSDIESFDSAEFTIID